MAEIPGMQNTPPSAETQTAPNYTDANSLPPVERAPDATPQTAPVDPNAVHIVDPAVPALPATEAESVIAGLPPEDDAMQDLSKSREDSQSAAAWENLERAFATPKTGEQAPKDQTTLADKAKLKWGDTRGKTKSVPLDVIRGAMELPTQAVGGGQDALQEIVDLAGEVGGFKAPQVVPDSLKAGPPKSVTGGLVRGISQFLLPFGAAGKAVSLAGKGVKAVGLVDKGYQAGKLASGIITTAKGMAVDFAAFDGHQQRLSDLIEAYPVLSNPVTEYLKSDMKDSELEGRLKNLAEGAVPGHLLTGFVKAVKYLKLGQRIAGFAKTSGAIEKYGQQVLKEDFHALGDPTVDDVLFTRTVSKTAAATEKANPGALASGAAKAAGEGPVEINWASINTADDVKTLMQKMADMSKPEIDSAKRGTRSWETTKISADQENAWKILSERSKGQALNAEQNVAVKQAWVASGEKLKEVADLAASAPTDANLLSLRKMMVIHNVIQKEAIGAGSEAGRALNALKIPVGSGVQISDQIQHILESTGGNKVAHDLARHISTLSAAGMGGAIEKLVEKTALAKSRDVVAQIWMNSLLSNPQTWVANGLSSIGTAMNAVLERQNAAFISQKMGTANGVAMGEALAMAHGAVSGFRDYMQALSLTVKKDGLVNTIKKGLTEEAPDAFDSAIKYEASGGHLAADNWGIKSTNWGRAMDVADAATQVPNRILSRTDNFFKSIGYRMELHAQAVRQATSELKGGIIDDKAFKNRVAAIVENPPDDIRIESINAATYTTFTNKPNDFLKKGGDWIQSAPVIGRILLPFKNTPINILTYSLERTPMAPFVKSWRADVEAGGARADIALSRMATGTSIMQLAMDMAMKGQITGKGPDEAGQKANWLASNRPYSAKLGNTWVTYNRLDPMGFTLGIAADIAEAASNAGAEIDDQRFGEAMAVASFAIANNTLSKTYMRGMADFVTAVSNPQMKADGYTKRLFASMIVPSGVASAARLNDPMMRTADDHIDALFRRIPGLSKDLPLYRDNFGRTIDYRSGMGALYDVISPVYLKKLDPEPIDNELSKLQYYPDVPRRKVSFPGGVTVELDPHQYSRYVELQGNGVKHPAWGMGLKDFLNKVVTGKHAMSNVYKLYSDGPQGGKRQFIERWINSYRDLAERKMLDEDPSLKAEYQLQKKLKPTMLRPDIMGQRQ